ncbi:MAG TPA: hypothetical protein VFW82_08910 [Dyella sp.]|nr:hypothetical protein [Dyella sp.]
MTQKAARPTLSQGTRPGKPRRNIQARLTSHIEYEIVVDQRDALQRAGESPDRERISTGGVGELSG